MDVVKVNIMYPINEGPSGGGNQFLKLLRNNMERMDLYSEKEDADVVIFNSHQSVGEVIQSRRIFPNKIFIKVTNNIYSSSLSSNISSS